MLPRGERLTKTEFARVFETGRPYKSTLLQLRVLHRAQPATAGHKLPSAEPLKGEVKVARAAFVAGKKLGTAVVRNGLRRRVREIYRLSKWRREPSLCDCDLVFLMSPAALAADAGQLRKALDDLLERAKRENVRTLRTREENHPQGGHPEEVPPRGERTVKRVWKQPGVQNDGNSRRAGSERNPAGDTQRGETGSGDAAAGEQEGRG
jgi:ribonuclease P protein component